jgi:hypothetical protein
VSKCDFSGPEFGGAIGLMFFLASTITVSLNLICFSESFLDCLKQYGGILVKKLNLNFPNSGVDRKQTTIMLSKFKGDYRISSK